MTSHHPLLLGADWRYPADLAQSLPVAKIAPLIGGTMFNLEISGHADTVVLAGGADAPCWPPLVSCTLGKYLGKDFGCGTWTRRSTRCARPCVQCSAVFSPRFDPTVIQPEERWALYPRFDEVEYSNGRCATFWPEAAEAVWQMNGLSRDESSQRRHRSVQDELRGLGGPSANRAVTAADVAGEPLWRTMMLAALDERVTEGSQQFTSEGLNRILGHHEAPAGTPPAVASEVDECKKGADEYGVTPEDRTSAFYSKVLTRKHLSDAQRESYLKMHSRRAARNEADVTAARGAATVGTESETPVVCAPPKPTKIACCLCLEDSAGSEFVRPCAADSCSAVACVRCWERYLQLTMGIGTSRFACPVIPCFSCREVLPTIEWARCGAAAAQLSKQYAVRAAQLMTVRCVQCKRAASVLPQAHEAHHPEGSLSEVLRSACKTEGFDATPGEHEALVRAETAWLRCSKGAAKKLAAKMLTLPLDLGQLYAAIGSVGDVERRLALLLGLLSHNPIVPGSLIGCGCAGGTCFKCKAAHGVGEPCACSDGALDETKQQTCPACRVPAPAPDPACASVLCVCGKYYEALPEC